MQGRKPSHVGKKNRREKKRKSRPAKRQAQGKKPLVEPLKIAPEAQRKEALKEGKMVFFDGKKKISLPLVCDFGRLGKGSLQGIYKRHNGDIVTFRAFPGGGPLKSHIGFFKLMKSGIEVWITSNLGDPTFAHREPDLGHALVDKSMRGEGLGIKAVSKTEREQRARNGRVHKFYRLPRFEKLFEKLHYEVVNKNLISKSGKIGEKYDMSNWHGIEAIDPKNGKAKMFFFKIKKR